MTWVVQSSDGGGGGRRPPGRRALAARTPLPLSTANAYYAIDLVSCPRTWTLQVLSM